MKPLKNLIAFRVFFLISIALMGYTVYFVEWQPQRLAEEIFYAFASTWFMILAAIFRMLYTAQKFY